MLLLYNIQARGLKRDAGAAELRTPRFTLKKKMKEEKTDVRKKRMANKEDEMGQGAAEGWLWENEMVMDSVDEAREGRIL